MQDRAHAKRLNTRQFFLCHGFWQHNRQRMACHLRRRGNGQPMIARRGRDHRRVRGQCGQFGHGPAKFERPGSLQIFAFIGQTRLIVRPTSRENTRRLVDCRANPLSDFDGSRRLLVDIDRKTHSGLSFDITGRGRADAAARLRRRYATRRPRP